MARRHIIITGPGRTGTTPLMAFFTRLGLPTGYTNHDVDRYLASGAKGGLEWPGQIDDPNAPYIVKQPHLCDTLGRFMQRSDVFIDHALIPLATLTRAATSRRENALQFPGTPPSQITAGTWDTDDLRPGVQELILAEKTYNLMLTITEHEIPHVFLLHPLLATNPEYLFAKLRFLLDAHAISKPQFMRMYPTVFKRELIRNYRS
jgi:hypothetical protein